MAFCHRIAFGTQRTGTVKASKIGLDSNVSKGKESTQIPVWRFPMDPITDIFRTMHVTAFGLHRLEATAPWGVIQEKQTEEKVTPSDTKKAPTDLAHFAMLSRGNCWLSVEGIPEPVPLTGGDCFVLARGTSIVLRDRPRTRPRWSFREIGAKAKSNVAHYGGGGAPTTIVCGSFSFD